MGTFRKVNRRNCITIAFRVDPHDAVSIPNPAGGAGDRLRALLNNGIAHCAREDLLKARLQRFSIIQIIASAIVVNAERVFHEEGHHRCVLS